MVHREDNPGEAPLVGRTLARGLRVLHPLGSTPHGLLYQAQYPNGVGVGLVALRADSAGGDGPQRELLSRATRVQHLNVAAVYTTGELEDGSFYAVLEQLVGEPLSQVLAVGTIFGLNEAIELVLQAAAGLQAAFSSGLAHGNVSPNIMLVTRAPLGQYQLKLTGFSLSPSTAAGPSASPERLAGDRPDERSEVFSLGAVLHHLLTGRPPDGGPADRSVPRPARAVVARALAPTPDKRFQAIAELAEALDRVASDAAKPRRLASGRVRVITAAVAGLVLLAGGMWLLPDSKRSATRAEPPAVLAQRVPPTLRKAPPPPTWTRSLRQGLGTGSRVAPPTRDSNLANHAAPVAQKDLPAGTGTAARPLGGRFREATRAFRAIVGKLTDKVVSPRSESRRTDTMGSDSAPVDAWEKAPRPSSNDARIPPAVEKVEEPPEEVGYGVHRRPPPYRILLGGERRLQGFASRGRLPRSGPRHCLDLAPSCSYTRACANRSGTSLDWALQRISSRSAPGLSSCLSLRRA